MKFNVNNNTQWDIFSYVRFFLAMSEVNFMKEFPIPPPQGNWEGRVLCPILYNNDFEKYYSHGKYAKGKKNPQFHGKIFFYPA